MDVVDAAYDLLSRFERWTPPAPRETNGLGPVTELALEVGARRYLTAWLRNDEKVLSRLELAGLPNDFPEEAYLAIYPSLAERITDRFHRYRIQEHSLYAVLRGARLVREVSAVTGTDTNDASRILLDRGIVLPHKRLEENIHLVNALSRERLAEEEIAGMLGYAQKTVRRYIQLGQ